MATRPEATDPLVLGLTGPIACGKTTVGDMLLELGALERIDADDSVHELMLSGTDTSREIASSFGAEVLREDGSVDRARLSELVFGHPDRLGQLEKIVHPAVRRLIRRRLADLNRQSKAAAGQPPRVVVVDAVKLLQSDLLPLCSAVWVVTCSRSTERERLLQNRNLTSEQAEARLASQPKFEDPQVTDVIENSGSIEDLKSRVEGAWHRFLTSST